MFSKFTIKFIVCLGLLSSSVFGKTDCDVLTKLLNEFEKSDMVSWKENTNDCCSLDGITCSNDRITKIDLKEKDLGGSIAKEIGELSELSFLDLRYNHISGSIPDSIVTLSKLNYFNLGANHDISGSLPESICKLTSLSELYLYENSIEGNIPDCIGDLTNLIELCLDSNRFIGYIPSSIGDLKKLKHLDLEKNKLIGTIPEELSNLKNLEIINLQGNSGLIGNIPEIENVKDCNFGNSGLCVKEGSNACSNGLPKCSDEDLKKAEDFDKNSEYKNKNKSGKNGKGKNGNNGSSSSSSGSDSPKKSAKTISIIILIIVIILLLIVGGVYLYKRNNNNNEENQNMKIGKSSSTINMLPITSADLPSPQTSPVQEQSFVVLSNEPPKDNESVPPKLTLDDSIFNYIDANKSNLSLNEDSKISKTSTGIDQEQYQKQIQYNSLIQNQSYYLS